jgi:hypothetical protein
LATFLDGHPTTVCGNEPSWLTDVQQVVPSVLCYTIIHILCQAWDAPLNDDTIKASGFFLDQHAIASVELIRTNAYWAATF